MSLRKILIGLGLLIVLLPYLGFPSWLDITLSTLAGLAIIFLLTLFEKINMHRGEVKVDDPSSSEEAPSALHTRHEKATEQPFLRVKKR